ncbi:hypothetical protein F7734_56235 [Scytonema sp. UIC 10036]|uniref:hypothetical protein n=1 Tax=Scytonema sp. UIC 10036 TaxID=2304196 RepID=UPI0012DAD980|nr:hypothetical protein [Scytonema sp. UIC 10036]MUH01127.1 hypothetical protein [Scytonema sp. UIC 10036]
MSTKNSINLEDISTPKADLLRHIKNFSEASIFFSVSLGLALAATYFRQVEIILAVAYVIAIIYTVLTFDNCPKSSVFRFAAITLGLSMGIRELLIFFWVPVLTSIVVVIAVGIFGYMAYRYLEAGLNPKVGGR